MIGKEKIMVCLALAAAAISIYLYRPHSRFFLTFIPPRDLHKDIIASEVIIGNGYSYRFRYKQKYAGTYLLGFAHKGSDGALTADCASVEVTIEAGNGDKVKKKFPCGKILGRKNEYRKEIIGFYKVPEDVGVHENITLGIKMEAKENINEYSHAIFFLRRAADL